VHRDIKPSNLMVDHAGKIWITDFGLARSQTNQSLTQSGDVIGTMRYMSPEQACGRSAWVDGRSDIYSLAVTFYEMLSLHQAYPGENGPSILQAIDHCDVIGLRKHCNDIPTDLETVIAKAMAKSRDDRYETSQAFADDLRRVLGGLPTVARPPTVIDRISRFSAQHKRGALLTVLVCALGFVGFAISTALIAAEKQRSDHHKFRALRNERLLRNTVDELGSKIAEELAAVPSAEPVRRRLLRQTIDYYETFAESALDDPGLRHDLAITYGKIGTLQDELRSSDSAIDALRRSEHLYEELAHEQPVDAQAQLDWSISQNNLAESLHRAGQLEQAATYFARAVKTQEKLANAYPTTTYRAQLSTTLNNLGLLLSSSGATAEAEATYRRSVDLLKTPEGMLPDPVQQQQLAAVLSNLSALLAKDQPTRAIECAREALANQTVSLEKNRGNAKLATQVITTLQTLGMAQSANGDLQAAIESFEKSVDVGRQLLARWPEQPQYRRDHVISQNHLGLALSKTGQLESALAAFEDALGYQRSLAKDYPNDAETQSMLGGVLNNLGFLYQTLGRRNAAMESYDEAVKCQSQAATLAPQVARYQSYLEKHRYNLGQLESQQ
ncbi:MAG: tetratricopeptide repeat protein, partial [Planctomycetales bacterium]|nr:tetratricopeptide repeat protein [Planctomycetales bacterium]